MKSGPQLVVCRKKRVGLGVVGFSEQLDGEIGVPRKMLVGAFAREDDFDAVLAWEGREGELGDAVEVEVVVFAVVGRVGEVAGQGFLVDLPLDEVDAEPLGRALGDAGLVEARIAGEFDAEACDLGGCLVADLDVVFPGELGDDTGDRRGIDAAGEVDADGDVGS